MKRLKWIILPLPGLALALYFLINQQVEPVATIPPPKKQNQTVTVSPAPKKISQHVEEPTAKPHEHNEEFEPGDHPHPISEQHKRIFAKNALVGNILSAVDLADAQGLRNLYLEYEYQFPQDVVMLQGIEIIANCIDNKDYAAVEKAKNYNALEKASRLRRYVNRHCLKQN